ncbi:tail fiber protein [Bradyrhizobium sp. INPA01-394B]|uniref:Tail fiber protein n=1 Tax=Bradyrhizobium campsiandrae TaxID=1729892 RepID=A0ABR7U9L4_9BRAD|nr:tail fiber protein [Bradyrhizobium campsiandrae]MBC9876318.1 tail fiber protein [Bradyrhizobium campsiandrae]MBC9980159.1 tail fiber protein [Bradyrhizobium campsiandrae]
MTLYKWSQTASVDATADSTINWAEGQAPSSVNDSARGMMAAIAKYRDDIAGAIVTGGTSTAYTVASYQGFGSWSALANQVIAFSPHATCGAMVTLNVDGLGAKPLRSSPNVDLPAGTIIQGTPYLAVYNSGDQAFYLQSFFGNPYSIPIGASVDFWGLTAPNSSFVLAYGQAISRTTYATLFSLFGTTYGAGDGSTTFNIPDCRGRFVAGRDDMGGSAASRLTNTYLGNSALALGATGGTQAHTLIVGELPPYTPSGVFVGTTDHNVLWNDNGAIGAAAAGGQISGATSPANSSLSAVGVHGTLTMNPQGGTSTPFAIIPPTIIANRLLRII